MKQKEVEEIEFALTSHYQKENLNDNEYKFTLSYS